MNKCLIYSLYIKSTNHWCDSFHGDFSQTDFMLQPLYNTVPNFDLFTDSHNVKFEKKI